MTRMRMGFKWCEPPNPLGGLPLHKVNLFEIFLFHCMKQYLIIAQDGKDDDALNRRKEIRPIHLAGARKLKENGNFVIGGAMLDDDSNMRGSIMIVQF